MDHTALEGMEVRLTNVPIDTSVLTLKAALKKRYFNHVTYDFLVILEKTSEEIFWQLFDNEGYSRRITARVVIPNDRDGLNLGERLINRNISLSYKKLSSYDQDNLSLCGEKIDNPETTNQKFIELREKGDVKNSIKGLQDGILGYVSRVSCGAFDLNDNFETTYTWTLWQDQRFRKFGYFGDVWPKKFHISLTESDPRQQPLKWEWMDIHESNIRGLIFEDPQNDHPYHRVVYFVLDKPPQFYQRTEEMLLQIARSIHSRISHLSIGPQLESVDLDICNVPWIIQYSRVIKVEYENIEDFSLDSYKPRLSQARKETLISFNYPGIEASGRTLPEMRNSLKAKLDQISSEIATMTPQYSQALLKLLFNCSVSATSEDATAVIDWLIQLRRRTYFQVWSACESLSKLEQEMGTAQVRALRRLYGSLPENSLKVPERLMGNLLEPLDALQQHFNIDYWHDESQGYATHSKGIYVVMIYPSHIELEGPINANVNSITERYGSHNFIRVRFVDNDRNSLKAEAGIDLGRIVNDRIFLVLNNEQQLLALSKQEYEFVGYSVSGLKKKKSVWFVNSRKLLYDSKKIINHIGNWSDEDRTNEKLAKHPSKWGARIALAFTESISIGHLSADEWFYRKDEGDNKDFPNTDGCGLISAELCDTINTALAPFGFAKSRAFQIRFGGAKGVVYAGAKSLLQYNGKQYKMLLRKSQLKFQIPYSVTPILRVVSTTSDSYSSLFFDAALKAFEDSGADTEKVEKIYDTTYNHLANVSSESIGILQQIFRIPEDDGATGIKARYSLLKLAVRLKSKGIVPEDYQNSYLTLYLARLAERARDKDLFKIPIPRSYSVLGLTDDYRILEINEVFIRAYGRTIEGSVLIYRDPIIHIGDIQKATAVTQEEMEARMKIYSDCGKRMTALNSMDNVIFFSQKENPPLPNKLSGGDLDGDRFEIVKEDCGFWGNYQTSDPSDYTENESKPAEKNVPDIKKFDITEIARFIGRYIQNDCFSELQERLMCLADMKLDGLKDDDVKKLAPWLSKAVDYAKSGEAVNLAEDVLKVEEFRVEAKPDFVRAINRKAGHDPKGEYYKSRRLLGRIYRRVQDIKYAVPENIDRFGLRGLQEKVELEWQTEMEEISELDTGSDLNNAKLANLIRELDFDMERIVTAEAERYREYLALQYHPGRLMEHAEQNAGNLDGIYGSQQNLPASSEVSLFLRKKQDDYPDQFIRNLLMKISSHLRRYGAVQTVNLYPGRLIFTITSTYGYSVTELLYRLCLFKAWKAAIGKENCYQSYAFICLYTLYCEKLHLEMQNLGK